MDQFPPQLPRRVVTARYAPFSKLLPGAAAIVHHGGVGTTSQALRAGIPQVVVPMAFDQFDNAQRVYNLSCGSWLPMTRCTSRRLLTHLERLPQVATQCSAVARQLATNLLPHNWLFRKSYNLNAIPFMPRSLVVTLWLATLLDSSLASYVFAQEPTSPTQSFENEQASDNLFEVAPTVHPNPIRRAPLIAIVEFESSQPVVPSLIISDGQREWEQPWSSTPSRRHRLAAWPGLRPNRQHTIRVKVVSADQASQLSLPLTFVTPPLPDNFPPLRTVVSQPDRMAAWFNTVLSQPMARFGKPARLWLSHRACAEGEVVWYCHVKDRVADMRILENGHILYQHGNYRYAYEIDILGRDVRRSYADNLTEAPDEHAIAVDVDTMHHDLFQLPGGNLFTLATELVEFDKFPSSEHDPQAPWQPAHVVCDAVVEFNPTNGQIVDQLHLLDVLDPQRFGYMALSGFWKDKYNARIDGKSRDRRHANAATLLG